MDANLINAAVKRVEAKPFVFGSMDCCTFVCDLVVDHGRADPMDILRGAYSTSIEAERIQASYGGFVPMIQFLAGRRGYTPRRFPFEGADLGVVATPGGPILAAFCDDRFVAKSEHGILVLRRAAGVLAWSFE